MKKSILSLLGLDLVDRLQADLKIYRSKYLHEASNNSYATEVAEYEEQKAQVEENIRKVNDDKTGLENSIAQLSARIIVSEGWRIWLS